MPAYQGRFDDIDRRFQTLYASSHRLAPFLECLASFRAFDRVSVRQALEEWRAVSHLGRAQLKGGRDFVDICGADWMSRLTSALAAEIGQGEFLDASGLYQAKRRSITQLAAKEVRRAGYAGIFYRSRWANDLDNWAIFEPWSFKWTDSEHIDNRDVDFLHALDLLQISSS